jgi:hypothetical protein
MGRACRSPSTVFTHPGNSFHGEWNILFHDEIQFKKQTPQGAGVAMSMPSYGLASVTMSWLFPHWSSGWEEEKGQRGGAERRASRCNGKAGFEPWTCHLTAACLDKQQLQCHTCSLPGAMWSHIWPLKSTSNPVVHQLLVSFSFLMKSWGSALLAALKFEQELLGFHFANNVVCSACRHHNSSRGLPLLTRHLSSESSFCLWALLPAVLQRSHVYMQEDMNKSTQIPTK